MELNQKLVIPKVIHQTYTTRRLPPEILLNISRIKQANPDWEYRFYDDHDIQNYVSKYFPQYKQVLNKINPKYGVAKADFFRYLLLYREGGVYLDIKSALLKPLNDVIQPNDEYILSHWRNGVGDFFEDWGKHDEINFDRGEFQQWFIVSRKKHPFLKAIINQIVKNIARYKQEIDGVGRIGVFRLTGPIAYTLSLAPILHLHSYRLVDSDSDLGFMYSIHMSSGSHHKTIFKFDYRVLQEPIVLK